MGQVCRIDEVCVDSWRDRLFFIISMKEAIYVFCCLKMSPLVLISCRFMEINSVP